MTSKLDGKELESLSVSGIGDVIPGMKVEHPIFGLGKVEAIFEFSKSDSNTIRVNFEKHGSKALVPEYAKLTIPKMKGTSFFGRLFKK